MPAIRRTLKNVVKNYSDAQVKVREATSNDPWGPSSTLMSEIADLTYNVVAFTEIMQMVWKRLNDDGKNWRHVYKSLVVLDYIIKTGSEKVAQQCKENFHAIKTLTSFQHIDADNKDQGMNVREKAKQLVAMLSDDERLKNERAKALKAKERFAQNAMGVGNGHSTGPRRARMGDSPSMREGYQDQGYPDSSPGSGSGGTPSEIEHARPSSAGEEELQLQLAMVLSKEEHEENLRKQKSDDIKLQMAIEQSREQAKTGHQPSTLLDLAGPSSSATASASSSDPWGLPPAQAPRSSDPWGGPLPPPQSSHSSAARAGPGPDPWGSSSGASGGVAPSVTDPWGMPVSNAAAPPGAGAWSSTSPTPQASAWGAPSPTSHPSASGGVDAFGAPLGMPTTNGASSATSNPIDNEFDLLSARSTDNSPTKSSMPHGLDEFDLLSGGSKSNGSSDGAFGMAGLEGSLPSGSSGKKKSAEEFLGGHANLVNLDQLVSKAPPPGNNPFAMTTGNNNPFHDPNANVRVPMAQMAASSPSGPPGFASQPTASSLLPAPLLPAGNPPPPTQQASGYNPFL